MEIRTRAAVAARRVCCFGLGLVLAGVAFSGPAEAHSPLPGIGQFQAGLLHPLAVPEQLLALAGLGLLLGQQGSRHWRVAIPAFAGALLVGLVIIGLRPLLVMPSHLLLVVAAWCGLRVAAAQYFPRAIDAIFAAAVGLLLGLDSAAAPGLLSSMAVFLSGTLLAAVVTLSCLALVVGVFKRSWQRVGVRVVGSWTAASALMVLAFELSGIGTAAVAGAPMMLPA